MQTKTKKSSDLLARHINCAAVYELLCMVTEKERKRTWWRSGSNTVVASAGSSEHVQFFV